MSDSITDPEGLIKVLVDSNPDSAVLALWTELQAERENSKYWEGRTNASRGRLADERDGHEAEITKLKAELAAAQAAVSIPKITLMALDKAEKDDRKNKIDAIKAFRNDTGLGLSESKQAVEWVWEHTQIRSATPAVVEHVARFSESDSQTQRVLYNTLVLDRYFGNIQEAELFCMEVWKLLG